ncbi:uncharacterized protein [Asterias amurensis]|uniref:uncharacterized protein n=1 Tax=Asterias amurensis TaxID=7602 RepID=UPI003AB6A1DC
MNLENSSEYSQTAQPYRAHSSSHVTEETLYKLLTDLPGESPQPSGDQWVVNASEPTSNAPVVTGGPLPSYSWNLVVGITASVVFLLVTAAVLFGLTVFRNYMKKRNRTLSADTGVFSPRRGSKAGLDMIDNTVVMIAHSSLERSGSIRKQIQKFLSR